MNGAIAEFANNTIKPIISNNIIRGKRYHFFLVRKYESNSFIKSIAYFLII